MVESPINANVKVSLEKSEQKIILDTRTFKPHEPKEVERWTHTKMRHDKWIVVVDCVTGEIRVKKLE
jgi:hypothetical protein